MYYGVFSFLSLIAIVANTLSHGPFQDKLTEYFMCEATGEFPGKVPCDRSFGRLGAEILAALAYVMVGFFPFVSLIYVVNIDDLKAKLKMIPKRGMSSMNLSSQSN